MPTRKVGDKDQMQGQSAGDAWLAGLDGCRAGWLIALVRPTGDNFSVRVLSNFSEIADLPEQPAVISVDMPIGLPEQTGYGGRAAENAIRPLLGARQSSVFSVPSRAALQALDYRQACEIALSTSEPPRKISRQLFMITPKIREVDNTLRMNTVLATRVHEVHPELAFWRLNGERALDQPKKVKSRPYEPGLALRRALLIREGLPRAIFEAKLPQGAGPDDLLDALACAAIARRIQAGTAKPFPDPAPRDSYGLPMAIWA